MSETLHVGDVVSFGGRGASRQHGPVVEIDSKFGVIVVKSVWEEFIIFPSEILWSVSSERWEAASDAYSDLDEHVRLSTSVLELVFPFGEPEGNENEK